MEANRVLVLLNEKSGALAAGEGSADTPQQIRRGFAAHGIEAEVRAVPSAELAKTTRAALGDGFDAVVAGGGDGTLNAVAAALVGERMPFGVLPLGTHNHFAKELAVPLDLEAAIVAIAGGHVEAIDTAEVNGRLFLNFSGIGLHPHVVQQRDVHQKEMGKSRLLKKVFRKTIKPLALGLAFLWSLDRLPLNFVTITIGGRTLRRLTPSVIACNNLHQMGVFGADNVSIRARDVLNLYIARATGGIGVVRLVMAALFRRLNTARDFEALADSEFTIITRRRRLAVSIDGEVVEMKSPLRYKIRPAALRVIMPSAHDRPQTRVSPSP